MSGAVHYQKIVGNAVLADLSVLFVDYTQVTYLRSIDDSNREINKDYINDANNWLWVHTIKWHGNCLVRF